MRIVAKAAEGNVTYVQTKRCLLEAVSNLANPIERSSMVCIDGTLRESVGIDSRQSAINRACKEFRLDPTNPADLDLLLGIFADIVFARGNSPNALTNRPAPPRLPDKGRTERRHRAISARGPKDFISL